MSVTLRTLALAALTLAFRFGLSLSASADSSSPPEAKGQGQDESRKPVKGLTPDQQEQALAFARTQHPELADLLETLKERNPKQYGKALQDLLRAQQRLHRMADQNPVR